MYMNIYSQVVIMAIVSFLKNYWQYFQMIRRNLPTCMPTLYYLITKSSWFLLFGTCMNFTTLTYHLFLNLFQQYMSQPLSLPDKCQWTGFPSVNLQVNLIPRTISTIWYQFLLEHTKEIPWPTNYSRPWKLQFYASRLICFWNFFQVMGKISRY